MVLSWANNGQGLVLWYQKFVKPMIIRRIQGVYVFFCTQNRYHLYFNSTNCVLSSNIVSSSRSHPHQREEEEAITQEMDVKVKSLSVLLNHSNYEVARASVTTFLSRLSWKEGNFSIDGSLRKFLVTDLTCKGDLYADRFLSMQVNNKFCWENYFKLHK